MLTDNKHSLLLMEKVLISQPFRFSVFLQEAEDKLLQMEVIVDKLRRPFKVNLILTISFKKSFLCFCFFKESVKEKFPSVPNLPIHIVFYIPVIWGIWDVSHF